MLTDAPARVHRSRAKARWATLLHKLSAYTDVTHRQIAHSCGVSRAVVQRWCDREAGQTMDLAALSMAPRSLAVAILRELADGLHVRIVDTLVVPDGMPSVARMVRELTDVCSTHALAAEDGRIDPHEAVGLRAEIREALDILHAADASLASIVSVSGSRRVQ